MLYPKNVPNPERVLRVIAGIALIGLGLSAHNLIVVGLMLASAVFIIGTGFIGWCPACALIGRKIKANERKAKL
jgi:hypothetical protein